MEYISVLAVTMEGTEDNLYNYTVDGRRSRYENCCSDTPLLSDDEIRRIYKYVRQNRIKESKHLIPMAKPVLDMTYPFRDSGKKICMIYEIRPEIYRWFICDSEQRAKENRERLEKDRRAFLMREMFFGVD